MPTLDSDKNLQQQVQYPVVLPCNHLDRDFRCMFSICVCIHHFSWNIHEVNLISGIEVACFDIDLFAPAFRAISWKELGMFVLII
jgi:hypothetical protein